MLLHLVLIIIESVRCWAFSPYIFFYYKPFIYLATAAIEFANQLVITFVYKLKMGISIMMRSDMFNNVDYVSLKFNKGVFLILKFNYLIFS